MHEKVPPPRRFPGIKFSFMSLFMFTSTDFAAIARQRNGHRARVLRLATLRYYLVAGSFWLSCSAAMPLQFLRIYLKSLTVPPVLTDGTKSRLAPGISAHEDLRVERTPLVKLACFAAFLNRPTWRARYTGSRYIRRATKDNYTEEMRRGETKEVKSRS